MPKRKKKAHKSKSRHSHTASSPKKASYAIPKNQQSTLYYFGAAFALIFLFCAFFIYLPTIRSALGFANKSIDPAALRGHRARLRRLYEKYNPNKLDEMEDILEKYRGREKELFKKLHKKYVKPNKKVREKERKERREKKRRRRAGIEDEDDDRIPNDETDEEAAARRRRKKERDRKMRKQERKKERGGKEYHEDWDDDTSEQKKNYGKYFTDDDESFGDDDALYEGEIDLLDDDDDE
eukprot:601205_1